MSRKSQFNQINVSPAVKRRRAVYSPPVIEIPETIFLEGEEGVYGGWGSEIKTLYVDGDATTLAQSPGASIGGVYLHGVDVVGFTQSTTAAKPTLVFDENRNAVFYDGIDDVSQGTPNTLNFFKGKTAYGFVTCMKWVSGPAFLRWSNPWGNNASHSFSFEMDSQNQQIKASDCLSATTSAGTVAAPNSGYCIWAGQVDFTTGAAKVWRNNTVVFSNPAFVPISVISSVNVPTQSTLGYRNTSNRSSFYMNSLGLWRTPLSDARIEAIIAAVAADNGLTL